MCWMLGCAFAIGPDGTSIVGGFKLGELADAVNKSLGGIADWALGAIGLGTSGLGGGLVLAIRKAIHYKSEAASIDAAVATAKHEGEDAGWDAGVAHAASIAAGRPVLPAGQTPAP